MRDLVLNRRLGRGTTTATFLLHRIRPPVWPGPERQAKFCHPRCDRHDLCREKEHDKKESPSEAPRGPRPPGRRPLRDGRDQPGESRGKVSAPRARPVPILFFGQSGRDAGPEPGRGRAFPLRLGAVAIPAPILSRAIRTIAVRSARIEGRDARIGRKAAPAVRIGAGAEVFHCLCRNESGEGETRQPASRSRRAESEASEMPSPLFLLTNAPPLYLILRNKIQ
jgi:hypothetical protein